jgi:hypothetical protein
MEFLEPFGCSTVADTNEDRKWRIYAELAQRLITQARKLYANDDFGPGSERHRLCPGLDDHRFVPVGPVGAHFRTTKAAVKMHTLLSAGSIPSFIYVSVPHRRPARHVRG